MDIDKIRVEFMPKITDDQLWGLYIRNDICEQGYGKETATKVLKGNSVIVGAFYEDLLVGIARALFDGVFAYIAEFNLECSLQGDNLEYENGSLIEKDVHGIAKKMASMLISELKKMGATFFATQVLENCGDEVYQSFGMTRNENHCEYILDIRPYDKWDGTTYPPREI